jgi:5-methylcytosine-specific restriction endonuclease McrA
MTSRPGRWALRDPRWPALRLQALRRDGWRCVKCGSRVRLEVDHILPVRDRPDLAFELSNVQTLCNVHHAEKTRTETNAPQRSPEQEKWRALLAKDIRTR